MALVRVHPNELNFPFELNKPISCSIQLTNTTDGNVAFKVKTTSPKKYSVRPNTGMLSPNGSIAVVVTMQAQRDAPPDMQCKDKFLVQSTVVPSEDFSQDVFNKESGNEVFEAKLRVHYVQPVLPPSALREAEEEEVLPRPLQESDNSIFSSYEQVPGEVGELKAKLAEARTSIVRLTEEKKAALWRTQELEQEIANMPMKMASKRGIGDTMKGQSGFSFFLVLLVGLVGIILGYLLHLLG